MGYSYDMSNRLACDMCSKSGGVRKHKCPFGYCPPLAMCADCARDVLDRHAIHGRAIDWAADIKHEPEDGQRAFACFGLLLMAELLIRCDACAPLRVMAGAELVAAGMGYAPAPREARKGRS